MLGQVASFMESLHLTYDEVLNKIPYRTLVVMQRDKLHTVYGDVKKEITENELLAKGKIKFNN